MGRKEGQRTKGNTKPSSSARSAELLSGATNVITDLDISTAIFGLKPLTQQEESLIPDELKLALKKMSKKDVTTKLKALQEFQDVCSLPSNESEPCLTSKEGVLLILPYWPRLYTRLANDTDRRVREATQKAHLVVVSRVGRDLAPFLKALVPSWHVLCSDPHIPASIHAKSAFLQAFNGDSAKSRDAILFCQLEILAYIAQNLLQHTASTLSDPKTCPPEDMEEKFHRVIATSLIAYGSLLEHILQIEDESKRLKVLQKAAEMHSNILQNAKFWKFAHHQNLPTRQAWYVLAGSLSKALPLLLQTQIIATKQVEKLVSYVVGKLDESDSTISPVLWDAALFQFHTYQEWHQHIDVKKSVLAKVVKLLRSGSHVLPSIYPRILPLMHAIPLIDAKDYVLEVLEAIRAGLKTFVLTSSTASLTPRYQQGACQRAASACVTSFFEVALHALKHHQEKEVNEAVFNLVFDWLKLLLVQELDSKEKKSEADLVFRQFAKILSILKASSSQGLFEETWARFLALANSIDPSPTLFRLIYTISSANLIDQSQSISSTGKGNRLNGDKKLENALIEKPIANGDIFCTEQMVSVVENRLELALSQYCNKENPNHQIDNSQSFAMKTLECFPDVQSVDSERFMSLIDADFLSHITSKGKLDSHVTLCTILLSKENPSEQKKFYDIVLQFENQDWIFAFVSGLLKKPMHAKDEQESIKALICGDTFMPKLLETVTKSDGRLTDDGATLILASLKYASLMPIVQISQILSYTTNLLPENCRSGKVAQFVLKVVQTISGPDCQAIWTIKESQVLIEVLFDTLFQQDIYEKDLETGWILGLQCLEKSSGYSNFLGLIKVKAKTEVKKTLLSNDALSDEKREKLARLASQMTKVCKIDDALDIVKSFLPSETELTTVQDSYKHLTASFICPKLTFIVDEVKFPQLWPQHVIDFYFSVLTSIDNEPDICDLTTAFTSAMGHLLEESGNFPCEQPKRLQKNRYVDFVREKLGQKAQEKLWNHVIDQSMKYGHFHALAIPYLRLPSNSDDISARRLRNLTTQVLEKTQEGFISDQATLHTLQALLYDDQLENMHITLSTKMMKSILELDDTILDEKLFFTLAYINSVCRKFPILGPSQDSVELAQLFNKISLWKNESLIDLMFECDVSENKWMDIARISIIAELLALITNQESLDMIDADFLLCSTVSWIQTLDESKTMFKTHPSKIMRFAQSVLSLASEVGTKISELDMEIEDNRNISEEWHEFFAGSIFPVPLGLFVDLAPENSSEESLLSYLGTLLYVIPQDLLVNHELPAKFLATDVDAIEAILPNNLVALLNHLVPLLLAESRSIQLSAFHLLKRVMPEILKSEEDRHDNSMSISSEDDDIRELPRRLTEIIGKTEPVLEVVFGSSMADLTTFGEPLPAALPVPSAVYTACMAYLLTWKLVLSLIAEASAELRPKYSAFLRKNNYLRTLMDTLFHIMPMKLSENGASMTDFASLPNLRCLMTNDDNLIDGNEMHLLACSVYHSLLKHLPALVRSWWNLAEKKVANVVEKFTCNYATPTLWAAEVKSVQDSKATFDNMVIKVRPSVREVVAIYTIDEGSMELVVQLPNNFPLGPVIVDSGKKVGVTTSQWRTWMLQLTTFLQHQNGSVVDGLTLWKKNVDRRFEGVEECYICFFILHGSTYQMPKVGCPTCKKKFHSACLYKWFSTSQNSTCPLCRNLF